MSAEESRKPYLRQVRVSVPSTLFDFSSIKADSEKQFVTN
jgi:hypothetical protein